MHAEKLSISLPAPLIEFIEQYKLEHQCKTRSQVVEEALRLLHERELVAAYREADQELDPLWENVAKDGLGDETW